MTVPATTRKAGPYDGNDVATSFGFSFKVFTSADILVTMADVYGTESELVLDSDYSVTLNGDQDASPGGSITYPLTGTPLATGEVLVITGDVDYGQDYAVPVGGDFNPAALEDALDKHAMRSQQILETAERGVRLAITSGAGVSASLPAPVAGRFLGWNSTADAIINFSGSTSVAVTAFMETVLAAVSAAAARAALGLTAIGESLATAASAAAARSAIGAAASGLATASGLTMNTARVLLRTTAGTGALEEKTATELTAFLNAATTSLPGTSELATTAETKTGTDPARVVTPEGLKGALLFSNGFESSDQTVTLNSKLTVAHGLGAKPKLWKVILKCNTADLNYSVGDELSFESVDVGGVTSTHTSVDATNFVLVTSGNIRISDKNTPFTASIITAGNWRWVFRGWA